MAKMTKAQSRAQYTEFHAANPRVDALLAEMIHLWHQEGDRAPSLSPLWEILRNHTGQRSARAVRRIADFLEGEAGLLTFRSGKPYKMNDQLSPWYGRDLKRRFPTETNFETRGEDTDES